MINTLGMSKTDGLMVLIIALTFTLICGPIGGWLVDRYGSAKIFICGALFALCFVYPLFYLVDTKNTLLTALGVSAIHAINLGCTGGAQGAFLSNLFPTRYRFSGIAMCRELAGALIGGSTPFIATALVALGVVDPHGSWSIWTLFVCLRLLPWRWANIYHAMMKITRHYLSRKITLSPHLYFKAR